MPCNDSSVCIVGSGAAALITAHTLLADFSNVRILSRDRGPGGVWEADKVWSSFLINVHGEYRFSSLPSHHDRHLSAEDMRAYLESFAKKFLKDKITYNTEVLSIARPRNSTRGWTVITEDTMGGPRREQYFDKIVLCTGGCSEPRIPVEFGPAAVEYAKFHGPCVHSSKFTEAMEEVLEAVKPIDDVTPGHVVIVGGGKSAQDIAAFLAHDSRRRNVTIVFEAVDAVWSSSTPMPKSITKSRFLSVMSPSMELNTKLERFLHTTSTGSAIVNGFWKFMTWNSFRSLNVPKDSPLRHSHSLFWGMRPNDEPVGDRSGFYNLANKGHITLMGPATAIGLGEDGQSVELADGRFIKADAVILATGYTSSWSKIFDQSTMDTVGLGKHTPKSSSSSASQQWPYNTLSSPPSSHPDLHRWVSSIYRGIVPAANILNRDLAINGAAFSPNNGYVFECTAHWISSYFMEDEFLSIPETPEEAIEEADRMSAWIRRRYPGNVSHWTNASLSSIVLGYCWPQYADLLLNDMGLRDKDPAKGKLLSWAFKTIEQSELETLGRERRAKRQQAV